MSDDNISAHHQEQIDAARAREIRQRGPVMARLADVLGEAAHKLTDGEILASACVEIERLRELVAELGDKLADVPLGVRSAATANLAAAASLDTRNLGELEVLRQAADKLESQAKELESQAKEIERLRELVDPAGAPPRRALEGSQALNRLADAVSPDARGWDFLTVLGHAADKLECQAKYSKRVLARAIELESELGRMRSSLFGIGAAVGLPAMMRLEDVLPAVKKKLEQLRETATGGIDKAAFQKDENPLLRESVESATRSAHFTPRIGGVVNVAAKHADRKAALDRATTLMAAIIGEGTIRAQWLPLLQQAITCVERAVDGEGE